jgi:multidrug efflux pump subunit AcrB
MPVLLEAVVGLVSRDDEDGAGIRPSVLGGLLTSTLLNLFVVPALYLRFGGTRTS